jgi:ParB family chromosome partitioning protein
LARILDASDLSSASLSLIENLQREGLNPIEEAMGYHSLVHDFSLTQAKVAARVGKSRVYVTNLLRLLQLDEELRGFLASGQLSTGHAKVLLGLTDEAKRLEVAKRAVSEQWTVRQCEQAVDEIRNPRSSRPVLSVTGSNGNQFSLLAQQAQSTLKREVSIKAGPSGKGRISLAFEDQKDLENILASLGL